MIGEQESQQGFDLETWRLGARARHHPRRVDGALDRRPRGGAVARARLSLRPPNAALLRRARRLATGRLPDHADRPSRRRVRRGTPRRLRRQPQRRLTATRVDGRHRNVGLLQRLGRQLLNQQPTQEQINQQLETESATNLRNRILVSQMPIILTLYVSATFSIGSNNNNI